MSESTAERTVTVVGGGLAGAEVAYQLASRGVQVRLVEQKPLRRTPAQHSDNLCELVCSNSFRGAALSNAIGLLKEEMRRAGSLVMRAADATRVPAGGALAVDRDLFSAYVTRALDELPTLTRVSEIVLALPAQRRGHITVLATGPLTGDELAADLETAIGGKHLAYYDAIAPVVLAESIDMSRVFRASRWDKGEPTSEGGEGGDAAYLNCPMDKETYQGFVRALCEAEKVAPKEFEKIRYFEGCLPVEVMAERGEQTLAFGPMKPVGLTDPKTGRWPHAVVQLRQEDAACSAYNLVGFQTKMTYGEQARVLRMIPGLESAEFVRFGSVHRNTFVNAPRVLEPNMALKARPDVRLAGQITGVEGYVESAACGLLCGLMIAAELEGQAWVAPAPNTALGGLLGHLARERDDYQPSNLNWACLPAHPDRKLGKKERYDILADQALLEIQRWLPTLPQMSVVGCTRAGTARPAIAAV